MGLLTPFKKVALFLSKVERVSESERLGYIIRSGFRVAVATPFWYRYYKAFKSGETFTFHGRAYHYFYHKYNTTWKNERAIEVPIVWEILRRYRGKRILEVGNVLSHYFPASHDILDKYEKSEGVINEDVVDFQPFCKYDLIVSISTLEHVGWDETPREPGKILRAIENLRSCLYSPGEIVVTLPLGLNSELDKLLERGGIQFDKRYHLKRISKDNRWAEVEWNDISGAKYGTPFPFANALIVGSIEKS